MSSSSETITDSLCLTVYRPLKSMNYKHRQRQRASDSINSRYLNEVEVTSDYDDSGRRDSSDTRSNSNAYSVVNDTGESRYRGNDIDRLETRTHNNANNTDQLDCMHEKRERNQNVFTNSELAHLPGSSSRLKYTELSSLRTDSELSANLENNRNDGNGSVERRDNVLNMEELTCLQLSTITGCFNLDSSDNDEEYHREASDDGDNSLRRNGIDLKGSSMHKMNPDDCESEIDTVSSQHTYIPVSSQYRRSLNDGRLYSILDVYGYDGTPSHQSNVNSRGQGKLDTRTANDTDSNPRNSLNDETDCEVNPQLDVEVKRPVDNKNHCVDDKALLTGDTSIIGDDHKSSTDVSSSGVSETTCVVCLSSHSSVLLYPCRHVCLCTSCCKHSVSGMRNMCPVCRQQIAFFVQLH